MSGSRGARRGASGPVEVCASVDLLSPWVHEQLRVHRWRRRLLAAGVALVVLLAGGWSYQRLALAGAAADLRGEEAVAGQLTREIAALAPVQGYVDGVQRRVRTVQQAMLSDVDFAQVLAGLDAAAPVGVGIDSITVDLPASRPDAARALAVDGTVADPARGLEAATCPGPDPFAALVVVGCLTFSGTAVDRAGVGALVDALAASRWFVEPFVTTTTTSDGSPIAFSGSVALDPSVFSGRFDGLGTDLGTEPRTTGAAASSDEGQDR